MERGIGLDLEIVHRVLDFSVFRALTREDALAWFTSHHHMGFFHYSDNLSDVWRDVIGRINEVGFEVILKQNQEMVQVEFLHPLPQFDKISAVGSSAPEAICLAAVELVDRYPDVLKINQYAH